MKKQRFRAGWGPAALFAPLWLICISCTKLPQPDFSYAPTENPEAGEVIQFINQTGNATSYSWDFGDGTTSGQEDPEHIYLASGTYGVRLTAYNGGAEKSVVKALEINEPTVLGFVVNESTGQYVIPGAYVLVYDSKAEWSDVKEPPFLAITDKDGIAVFINMEPVVYYYHVILEDVDGFWSSSGNVGPIDLNQINPVIVYCSWEYYIKKGTSTDFSFLK